MKRLAASTKKQAANMNFHITEFTFENRITLQLSGILDNKSASALRNRLKPLRKLLKNKIELVIDIQDITDVSESGVSALLDYFLYLNVDDLESIIDHSTILSDSKRKYFIAQVRSRSPLPPRRRGAGGAVRKKIIEAVYPESDSLEEIHFRAFHPAQGIVNKWHTLLVYTHIESALDKIREDVKRLMKQEVRIKDVSSTSNTQISRGTELTIVPSCEGLVFNPESITFKWLEDYHRSEFRFSANESLLDDAGKGRIDIYAGPVIIGSLKFAMLFESSEDSPVQDREEDAKMFSKDDVFISYSRMDTDIARTFKTVLSATGLDVFLDVDDIPSGKEWEPELERRIKAAKVFQIFWSENYSQSENCRKEWEYALKQNKSEGYIRPVFWKKPLSPTPPAELNKYNFKFVELNLPKN